MNKIPKFTNLQASLLQNFLSSVGRPEGTMTYPQLTGFIFGVVCAPELIPPSEWLPIIFNDHDANYETVSEAEQILQAMMALYNDCSKQAVEGSVGFRPGYEIREPPLANLEADAPLSQWARGFVTAHTWFEAIWEEFTPPSLDQEIGSILMILTFFASPKIADAYLKEGKGNKSLENLAESVIKLFPDALHEYALLGQTIFKVRNELERADVDPSDRIKVGRNDPCPCGSGKKFKKCCGMN